MKTVYIPIGICPNPPTIDKPKLAYETIAEGATSNEIIKAFVKDIIALKGYAGSLEKLLGGYRDIKPNNITIEEIKKMSVQQ